MIAVSIQKTEVLAMGSPVPIAAALVEVDMGPRGGLGRGPKRRHQHISRVGCFLDFDFSPKSRRSRMKAPNSSKRHIYTSGSVRARRMAGESNSNEGGSFGREDGRRGSWASKTSQPEKR